MSSRTPGSRSTVYFARAQPVEEVLAVEDAGVAVRGAVGVELAGRSREQQPVERRPAVLAEAVAVVLGQLGERPGLGAAAQRLAAERLGPAAGRGAQLAAQEADHGVRDVEPVGVLLEVRRGDTGAHQMQGQVADHLGGRGDLHQAAQHPVGGGVHGLDVLEAVAEAERDGLGAQVGELAAGNLVVVDPAGRGGQAGLERGVDLADALPVRLQVADGLEVEAGGPLGVVGGGHDRRQRRLRSGARHGRHRTVDGVRARLDRGQVGGELAAGGVVGVQVHRQVELPAQRGHQGRGGRCAQQPGHVLDGQHVRSGVHDLLGEPQVVVEGVEPLGGVGQVGGVAERDLGDGAAGLPYGLDGGPHLLDVVEGVEDAEDVDAGGGGLLHEGVGHLGRVRGVAHGVAAAQQHLEAEVGHRLAQRG